MRPVHVYSGGTVVTVTGHDFDSVAEPRITLTVVITAFDNNTISASSKNETVSEVINIVVPFALITLSFLCLY